MTTVARRTRIISARVITQRERENTGKKKTEKRDRSDGLRREYDFSQLKGEVRGKYAARYQAGTNLVLLSPMSPDIFRTNNP
jgi:hypothetical protein